MVQVGRRNLVQAPVCSGPRLFRPPLIQNREALGMIRAKVRERMAASGREVNVFWPAALAGMGGN